MDYDNTTDWVKHAQHTPGPWEHKVNTNSAARFIEILGNGLLVAHIYGETKSIEVQANARLIEDAPELLKLLREVIDQDGNINLDLSARIEAAIGRQTNSL